MGTLNFCLDHISWILLIGYCILAIGMQCVKAESKNERVYENQFPPGSESIPLPGLVLYSIYMGEIHYTHLPFLLSSMKWNPNVKFVVINIHNETQSLASWKEILREYDVPNLYVEYLTHQQFSDVVNDKLGVRIAFNDSWYYKMCDFKPTLAYLFPQHADESMYKYWGYADLDVVWGNITRFSHIFQNGRPFVISGWWHTTGALNAFINEAWTRGLFLEDSKYVSLLTNVIYRNLDENGGFIKPEWKVDEGIHSMFYLEQSCKKCKDYLASGNHFNRGKNPDDTLFIGPTEYDWPAGGHSVWSHGSLTMPPGSKVFPPGRELMFFHIRTMNFNVDANIRRGLIEDMLTYGYTLPHFYPLFTRYACRNTHNLKMDTYQPYAKSCFASKLHHDNSV